MCINNINAVTLLQEKFVNVLYNTGEISHSPQGFSGLIYNTVWGILAILLLHNTGDNIPYSFQTVSVFFCVPHYLISSKGCETGPTVYSPYLRRLESLTICRCNFKCPQMMPTLEIKTSSRVLCKDGR